LGKIAQDVLRYFYILTCKTRFASYICIMKSGWTQHRFSGGALALDLVNTVVHRADPARTFDRLADEGGAAEFAEAAAAFRDDELGAGFQFTPAQAAEFYKLLDLREKIYASFAPVSVNPARRLSALSALLGASERALADTEPDSLLCQSVLSWMRINAPEMRARLRACPNCDWLFLDKSRNGSRIWCDMAVCGNRQKAKLNYEKRRRHPGQESKAA
jgi:predicted RNA-binding Zn ribbon-like protein